MFDLSIQDSKKIDEFYKHNKVEEPIRIHFNKRDYVVLIDEEMIVKKQQKNDDDILGYLVWIPCFVKES